MTLLQKKTREEVISDRLLFIYLIDQATKKGKIEGQKKLLKLIFYSEYFMLTRGLKGFNYNFFKYMNGPFSKEVYADRDILIENDVLDDQEGFKLTEKGKKILKVFKPIIENNKPFKELIDSVVNEFGKLKPWQIEDSAYDVKINGIKIRDLPLHYPLLNKIPTHQAKLIFDVGDENFKETFEIMTDKEDYESLKQSIESARTGRFFTFEEIFKCV